MIGRCLSCLKKIHFINHFRDWYPTNNYHLNKLIILPPLCCKILKHRDGLFFIVVILTVVIATYIRH